MSDFEGEISSFDQAAEALASAVDEYTGGTPDAPQYTPPETSQPTQPDNTQGDQGTTEEQSFLDSKSIDLSQLTPEQRDYIQAREREMQASYTQKTQALASERQQAQEAIQFLNELNTNPEFALEVQQRLGSELQRLGYTPEQAAAEAANQVGGFEDDDPYLAKINELEQWKDQQEQRIREAEVASRIDRESAVIMNQNPNFSEEDMGSIYAIALSQGGDLSRATDMYKAITQRSVERYLGQKDSVPATLRNQPDSSGHSEQSPDAFTGPDDKRIREAALARLRAEGYE
jgi:hypothetical protein